MMTQKQGQGRGLVCLANVPALAGTGAGALVPEPVVMIEPDNFLASPHVAAGPLLSACQAQFDLRLSSACCRKLAVRMAADGRTDAERVKGDAFPFVQRDGRGRVLHRSDGWPLQWQDACAAGVAAVQLWRNRQGEASATEPVARVCWRAIVSAISADTFGDGSQFVSPGDDWLWFDKLHPATVASDDEASRRERAARLWAERASGNTTLATDYAVNIGDASGRTSAAFSAEHPERFTLPAHAPGAVLVIPAGTVVSGRVKRLAVRLANLPPGRGKRAELIERLGRACVFLLQGDSLDAAAEHAGFKGNVRGRKSPGDRLTQACRRLGFKWQANVRERERFDGDLERLKVANAIADGRGYVAPGLAQFDSHVCAWQHWLALPASAHVQAWHAWRVLQPSPGHVFPRDKFGAARSARRAWIANGKASPVAPVLPVRDVAAIQRARLYRRLQARGLRPVPVPVVRFESHVALWRCQPRATVSRRAVLSAFDKWQLSRALRG